MDIINERRSDGDLRGTVDQAIEYARTHGHAAAATYMVENYVPSPLVERIMRRVADTPGAGILS